MTALGVLALVAAGFSFGNVPVGIPSLNYATLFVGVFLLVFSLLLSLLDERAKTQHHQRRKGNRESYYVGYSGWLNP